MTFTDCEAKTDLTDAEIAAIVRASPGQSNGMTGEFPFITIDAQCVLAGDHAEHAGQVGEAFAAESKAWFRWDSDGNRTLAWIDNCPVPDCVLFAGHPGGCQRDFGGDGAL
jgi:hypothetical protein